MEEIYLTHEIFIYDKKFYKKDKNKNMLIGNKNWLKILNQCGWEKLDTSWVRRLNKYVENKPNKSRWAILDTNNDGDCFFNTIAESFNYYNKLNNDVKLYDSKEIREIISNEINKDNFDEIIMYYKISKESGDFINKWNIDIIKNYEDLRKELIKTGHNYWADFLILQLAITAFDINIIILNEPKDIPKNKCKLYPLGHSLNENKKTIIIYFYNNNHFKLIGYFNNNSINTLFEYEELPKEIITIYNLDSRKV